MTMRGRRALGILGFSAAIAASCLVLLVSSVHSQSLPPSAPAAPSSPETAAPEDDRCATGYAFDPVSEECVACNTSCSTKLPGICGRGLVDCASGKPNCKALIQPGERRELCNGEDDDCDGQADEDFDKDRDGYTTCSGDCNDRDAAIHPDSVERCDGVDNNCNGLIDEGFNVNGVCTMGAGACQRSGHVLCSSNGLESYCDAVAGKSAPELCDGVDNDCNGKVDDGLGETTCGVGACRRTIATCQEGKVSTCVSGDPQTEICGNGIDDNCNGQVDEGFPNVGKACAEGVGACRVVGKFVCTSDGLSERCDAVAGSPQVEICGNGIDDDCDGTVDTDTEGLGNACVNGLLGECARDGSMVCDAKKGQLVCSAPPIAPQVETCDGIDNDCDGAVDNGVLNACGGCGKLQGEIGEACRVPGGDACATGKYACNVDKPGNVVCVLDASQSDGRDCTSDQNACTRDVCKGGACHHLAVANGVACEDGSRCTDRDACIDGSCVSGSQLACDDNNACTEDLCDDLTGCQHRRKGVGVVNACGGCEPLPAVPGEGCVLADKRGPCREGIQMCLPEGGLACVQTIFSKVESCNGIDDDCNGDVDDGLGVSNCGIGACRSETPNCRDGKPVSCVPKDPVPESCANPKSDDDCNGIVDDVAGLGGACPVAIGTCIVPGSFKCLGDAEKPVCVPNNPRDAEDENGNGVPNYCDRESVSPQASPAESVARSNASPVAPVPSLFETTKTRAVILPWREVFGTAVLGAGSSESAVLLVSGSQGDSGNSGFAVLRVKDFSPNSAISFQSCSTPSAEDQRPRILQAVSDGTLVASSPRGYLLYSKLASRLAASGRCQLAGQPIGVSQVRPWPQKAGTRECRVTAIEDIAILQHEGLSLAGAVRCEFQAGGKSAIGVDVLTRDTDGSFTHAFVPFAEAASVERVRMLSIPDRTGEAFALVARIDRRNAFGLCTRTQANWSCTRDDLSSLSAPIAQLFALPKVGNAFRFLMMTEDGSAHEVTREKGKPLKVVAAGGLEARSGSDSLVRNAVMLQDAEGRYLLAGSGSALELARVTSSPSSSMVLKPLPRERLLPQSSVDDVTSTEKLTFTRPHALALLPLKSYGGADLFAVFEMRQGEKRIGEMGFLFPNANEAPSGTLTELRFDGLKGTARLQFVDPTQDGLTYRVNIRAHHGGSLDSWIDGLEKGRLRFSVKGDPAAVGLWPIEITATASDAGGATASARVLLRRDGAIEAITESSGAL